MGIFYCIAWLVILVGAVAIELHTVQLVSVWFAIGALAALIAALLSAPFWLQLLVFALVSAASLYLSRPLAKKIMNRPKTRTNADAVIGMQGVVTEQVDNISGTGRVTVNGLSWAARSLRGEELPAGSVVLVSRIEGVKLIVSEAKVSAGAGAAGASNN